jgi:hypothetical protein
MALIGALSALERCKLVGTSFHLNYRKRLDLRHMSSRWYHTIDIWTYFRMSHAASLPYLHSNACLQSNSDSLYGSGLRSSLTNEG